MLPGGRISHTFAIRLAIQTWKWTSTELVVSAFWPRHQCSELACISQPLALRSMLRRKVLERSVASGFELHSIPLTINQMARRLGFSVVGLPHYTIWHLYEPSVDDLAYLI